MVRSTQKSEKSLGGEMPALLTAQGVTRQHKQRNSTTLPPPTTPPPGMELR
jgi:hypothetical protein